MDGQPKRKDECGITRSSATVPSLIRLADRLDRLGAHETADVLDMVALLAKQGQPTIPQAPPQQQPSQQKNQQQAQQQLADRFLNVHTEMLNATRLFANPSTIYLGMKRLIDAVKELGLTANALKQNVASAPSVTTPNTPVPISGTLPTGATASVLYELVSLADRLDKEGRHAHADAIDHAVLLMRKFAEEQDPVRPGNRTPLSTRYCPDHVGTQAFRISENIYQCPMDGRVYDYANGYTDYSGQKVPGGNVALQTPVAEPFGLPQRLYDPNQKVINTMN